MKAPAPVVQTEPAPPPVSSPGDPAPTVTASSSEPITTTPPFGIGLQVGGGVDGFSSSTMPGFVRNGGYWDARVAIGLRKIFSFELAYLGTAHD